MNNKHRFTQLLQLYLSGTISADEHAELFDLVATPEYDELLARSIYKDVSRDSSPVRADLPPHVADEMVRHIFSSEKNASRMLPVKKRSRLKSGILAISILLVIAVATWLLFFNPKNVADDTAFKSLIPANAIEYINDSEGNRQYVLDDSTQVTLLPHSKLYILPDKRIVFLEGKVFFNVTKNPAK